MYILCGNCDSFATERMNRQRLSRRQHLRRSLPCRSLNRYTLGDLNHSTSLFAHHHCYELYNNKKQTSQLDLQ